MKYECHGHIIADGVSYADSMARHKNEVDFEYIRYNLKLIATNGVGFYRDGGDKYMVSAVAKKIAGEYGIDYRTPIFISHKKGYYGSMYGRAFENMSEFHALVSTLNALNADFIKITVTGMLDFNNDGRIIGPALTMNELKEAVRIAEGEGLAVMAHVNGSDHIKDALEAGVKSIEHGYWPDSSIIDYFLQTNAVWVPTCAAVYNLIGTGRYSDAVMQKIHASQKKVLIEAFERGVLIASGSDCGAWMVHQGKGTLDEYTILENMGIQPEKGNKEIARAFKKH
jgi:hypothetical protein